MTPFATLVPLNDGNAMPQLGLGVWQVRDEQAAEIVATALQTGYRSVDTAAIYRNEAGVGEGLRASGLPRSELFVTTKLWNDSHARAPQALEDSLRRLGLDYVDLYLIHWPVAGGETFLQAWEDMIRLCQAGLARAIGVSNFTAGQLKRLMQCSDVIPAVNQIELHPGFAQRELRAFHADYGIATESWSPLGQGQALQHPVIVQIAQALGRTPAQVVLRWHLQNGLVAIPKSVTPQRIRENFAVFDFTLDEAAMQAIDALEQGPRLGPDPDVFRG